jgi:hypothetical protein
VALALQHQRRPHATDYNAAACSACPPLCLAALPCLRCSTGERNGFTVLTEEEFYDFHLTTPGLSVMIIKVSS